MGKLNDICNSIKSFEGFNFSDDMILDVSARIFISKNISDERKGKLDKPEFKTDVPMKKATDKQKNMLKKFKIEFNDDLSLMEASKLIEEKLGKK
jgi:hypothetical protein